MGVIEIMQALKTGGAEVMFSSNGQWGYRATIGRATDNGPEWLAEHSSLPDLAAAETFFREQAAIYYPAVVLP